MQTDYDRIQAYALINQELGSIDYIRDCQVMDAISTGNQDLLDQVTEEWYKQSYPYMKNPWNDIPDLEWYKLQLHCLNRSCKLAAYQGGVSKAELVLYISAIQYFN